MILVKEGTTNFKMKVKIFTKKTCPKCPAAKELATKLKSEELEVKLFDLEDPDGLAEASMYDVMATPTIIVTNDEDNEEKSFRGTVPTTEEVITVK